MSHMLHGPYLAHEVADTPRHVGAPHTDAPYGRGMPPRSNAAAASPFSMRLHAALIALCAVFPLPYRAVPRLRAICRVCRPHLSPLLPLLLLPLPPTPPPGREPLGSHLSSHLGSHLGSHLSTSAINLSSHLGSHFGSHLGSRPGSRRDQTCCGAHARPLEASRARHASWSCDLTRRDHPQTEACPAGQGWH